MAHDLTLDDAAKTLRDARRVMVIGVSGSGKSTLSKSIAAHLGADYISIDRDVTWMPGWQLRAPDARRAKMTPLLAADRWVMDGTYTGTFDLRLPLVDLVIWLRPRRVSALWGVVRRVWRHHGTVRDDMAEGCPEKWPDAEFLNYIWWFERKHAPRVAAALDRHRPDVPLVTLRNHAESAQLLAKAFAPTPQELTPHQPYRARF